MSMARPVKQSSKLTDMVPSHFNRLCLMLNSDDSWKLLASRIMNRNHQAMFDNDQIRNIERQNQSPAKEVLCCWNTNNPSIIDLQDLLIRMGHQRAVDFINETVLRLPPMSNQRTAVENVSATRTSLAGHYLESGSDQTLLKSPYIHQDNTTFSETQDYEQSTVQIRPIVEDPITENMKNIHRYALSELQEMSGNFDQTPLHDGGHLLGKGGFGRVFIGRTPDKASVAIKCFNPEIIRSSAPLAKRQFITEMEVLASCCHENMLRLIGYCVEREWCIVFEYMPNGSLEDRLACLNSTPPLSVALRLSVMQGVAHGLDYLHHLTPPLIHRDIKSANILLDENFAAKIGDCGTVRFGPRNPSQTHTLIKSGAIGTQAYMPPEYMENGEVSSKLDAFSYGVVLLEIITGLQPSDENREDKLLATHVREIVDDEDEIILSLVDNNVTNWRNDLVMSIYRTSKKLMAHKKRRRTVSESLPDIDSWSEDKIESIC